MSKIMTNAVVSSDLIDACRHNEVTFAELTEHQVRLLIGMRGDWRRLWAEEFNVTPQES